MAQDIIAQSSSISEADLAWAAGFIDGEGCITIVRDKLNKQAVPYYRQFLIVSNTNLPALERLQSIFGCGRIYSVKKRLGRANSYQWFCDSSQIARVLRLVYPYLVAKRADAEILFEFDKLPREKKGHKNFDLELAAQKEKLCQLLEAGRPRARRRNQSQE